MTRKNIMVNHGKTTNCSFDESEIRHVGSAVSLTGDQKSTTIAPHLESRIESGRNIIYCATFQIAWNKLQNDIIKEPIKLDGAEEDVAELNKQPLNEKDIDCNSYVAMAGPITAEFVNQINDELKRKFGPSSLTVDVQPCPYSIMSLCYMLKKLVFTEKFDILKKPIEFTFSGKKAEVSSFSIDKDRKGSFDRLSKQIEILYYKNDDDFAIKLKTNSPKEELILAKTAPSTTLRGLIERVNESVLKNEKIQEDDYLAVPYVNFDLDHEYNQFIGRKFLNKEWNDGWFISKAFQKIKFELNESGAILESFALISMSIGGNIVDMRKKPKMFIFNKPYLVMLRQRGLKLPYFAVWVGNDELLSKH